MSNGQERARQNLSAFQRWVATQTDDDFKQIVFRGQLNRGEVAKAIGIGKSALRQNPAIFSQNQKLKSPLRWRGNDLKNRGYSGCEAVLDWVMVLRFNKKAN
ncbi:hypothetical protein GJQ55_09875 [Venatoribacter cucullus]|uniref:Uncharacterized protein n=1 Tax=Venatoribacter cucullus TaxID=2661630 RepID=A0A9X7YNJ1_9GAMM|nr:VPA1267 family protein [Venatoribacter cucullus]QQD24750.1 hypothetical protein GJQ55_09875 [Venatoribacter cucullus]